MRLASRTDYALRAALELAVAPSYVTTEDLATAQDIPARYLGNILGELRRAGLISGRRGPEGGWKLARPATDIYLADVIRAVGGALADVAGTRPEHLHFTGPAEHLPDVLVALRAAERAILESVSLQAVATNSFPESVSSLIANPDLWV